MSKSIIYSLFCKSSSYDEFMSARLSCIHITDPCIARREKFTNTLVYGRHSSRHAGVVWVIEKSTGARHGHLLDTHAERLQTTSGFSDIYHTSHWLQTHIGRILVAHLWLVIPKTAAAYTGPKSRSWADSCCSGDDEKSLMKT